MRRTACALVFLAALGGCTSVDRPVNNASNCAGCYGQGGPAIPGVQGPWGSSISMKHPYAAAPPRSQHEAYAMMRNSLPLSQVQQYGQSGIVQASATSSPGGDSNIMQAQALSCPPGGCPTMAPPGGMLSPPGLPPMPGLPGGGPRMPGPGAGHMTLTNGAGPPGAVAAVGALTGQSGLRFPTQRTQVRFIQPSGMKIYWFTTQAKDNYSKIPIETPGRYNFVQGAVYRLKLTNIAGHPGLEIYPTLEVVPANKHTEAFLAHSAVPVVFTPADFKQIETGNFVVKVIYLPNPEYQDLAFSGLGVINSTLLEPGADPIKEAQRRGSVLLVIRMGNMDQEAPNTPAINAPGAGMQPGTAGHPAMGMMPPRQGPGGMMTQMPMMPPGMMPPGMMPPGMMPPNKNAPGMTTSRQSNRPPMPAVPGMPGMPAPQTAPQGQRPMMPSMPVPPYFGAPGAMPGPQQSSGLQNGMPNSNGVQLTSAQQAAVAYHAAQQGTSANNIAPASARPAAPSSGFRLPFFGSGSSGAGAACST